MTLIFCVDDNFGTMFNGRRQSRDIAVLNDVKEYYKNQNIYIRPYSENLFKENGIPYVVSGEFKEKDGVYFIEGTCPPDLFNRVDKIIIYHWGRLYPSDKHLDFHFVNKGFELSKTTTFQGNSHKEIRKEIFIRRK